MPIEKALSTYGLSFLSFLVSLLLWINYGFDGSFNMLIASTIATFVFLLILYISYKRLYPKKRYVLIANHSFYMFGSNILLESKLIKEKKNRNILLKKYINSRIYRIYVLPDTNFHFKVYELPNGLELVTYKRKNKELFKLPSFFDDCKKNNQSLIQFLGVEDFSIEKPIIDMKYSLNKEYAVVITKEEDDYFLRVYKYSNFWITTNMKRIFKDLLPHWHYDRDYIGINFSNLEDAKNKMNQEIEYLDHSFSIPNNSFNENQGAKNVD